MPFQEGDILSKLKIDIKIEPISRDSKKRKKGVTDRRAHMHECTDTQIHIYMN